jgi:mannose-6-phosphate isomerase class I
VAVKENDYFEIAPGTPHAIGPGVVLLETQRVLPGKSGKTYRLWDWNRRYDHEGKASVNGKARELHLEAALPLVDPLHQVGEAYVASLRRSFKQEMVSSKVSLKRYPPNFYSQVLRGTSEAEGKFLLENSSAYLCIIALQGALEIESRHKKKATLNQGWPALLPGGAGPYRCQGKGDFIIVAPAEGAISLRN